MVTKTAVISSHHSTMLTEWSWARPGVGAKTNEIPVFTVLLDRMDISDAVISADAMHAQRGHAGYLARRGAHYLFTVKRNQPGLHARLAALPWRQIPVASKTREQRHGRAERRTLKVTAAVAGLASPHAAQALQIVRRRRLRGRSGPPRPATPLRR
jgi:hypothetical protein